MPLMGLRGKVSGSKGKHAESDDDELADALKQETARMHDRIKRDKDAVAYAEAASARRGSPKHEIPDEDAEEYVADEARRLEGRLNKDQHEAEIAPQKTLCGKEDLAKEAVRLQERLKKEHEEAEAARKEANREEKEAIEEYKQAQKEREEAETAALVAETAALAAKQAADSDMEKVITTKLERQAEEAKRAAEKETQEAEAAQTQFEKEAAEADEARHRLEREEREEQFAAEELAKVQTKKDQKEQTNVNILKHFKSRVENAGATSRVVRKGGEYMLVLM